MVRMNIMMPEALAVHLKTVPNKSRYIVEALEQRIARERSRELREMLAQAYRQDAVDDAGLVREWACALEDGGWGS